MSQQVNQPIAFFVHSDTEWLLTGQKRLTNVALVKYKKYGKRFEIACYKNKVVNWRNGVEKDLDEVLQTTAVFNNVSKGVLAKKEDLLTVFGSDDEEKICLRILAEGELQVSEKEREVEYQNLFRDVASILAEKCINSESNRPFTISMLERTMKDLHVAVDPKRSAKQQALEVLPRLKSKLPIQRARMRLKMLLPAASSRDALHMLQTKNATIESQDLTGAHDSQVLFMFLVEPGFFRSIHDFVQDVPEGAGRLEVAALAATSEGAAGPDFDAHAVSAPVPASEAQERTASTTGTSPSSHANGTMQLQPVQPRRRAVPAVQGDQTQGEVLMARGPVTGLPESLGARRERFLELDELQLGWQVELLAREGDGPVDAVFYSPTGERIGAFTNARRAALQASKQQSSCS